VSFAQLFCAFKKELSRLSKKACNFTNNKFRYMRLTKQEEFAIQQFTGMHASEGINVYAVCLSMNLEEDEWKNIKNDCYWLSNYEIDEIEEYIKENNT